MRIAAISAIAQRASGVSRSGPGFHTSTAADAEGRKVQDHLEQRKVSARAADRER